MSGSGLREAGGGDLVGAGRAEGLAATPPPGRPSGSTTRARQHLVPCACLRGRGAATSPPPSESHTGVSLVAECDLETPSKGIPGNIVPADPCGYTTQLPGVAGLFFFCILQMRERRRRWGEVL